MSNLSFSPRFFRHGHHTVLLVALVGYLFVLPPLAADRDVLTLLLRAAITLVFFSACYALGETRGAFRAAVALALLAAVCNWLNALIVAPWAARLALGAALAFFLWVVLVLLRNVLNDAPVTLDKLFGAISVYLLLGLLWAAAYQLAFDFDASAFTMNDGLQAQLGGAQAGNVHNVFVYFSFVTLSTLGYGDMSPVGLAARGLVAAQAVAGPMYLAILIARLVSAMTPASQR